VFTYSATPQSIGKVLDNMFRLYGATFWKVIWISAGAALIANLPSLLMPPMPTDDPEAAMAAMRQFLWILPLSMLATLYSYAAILHRMHAVATGANADLGTALRIGLIKLFPLLVASILYFLALTVGLVLLVVPGILLGLSLYFYLPLIVVYNKGILAGLKSSHRLVWGNWWRTATVVAVPMFLIMAFYGILGLVAGITGVGIAVGGGGEAEVQRSLETYALISELAATLFSAFIGPLFAALLLVQLHDLELRREGSDLEARLAG
jgi:hypothetical protein